jgi:hypothetical protein
MSNLRGLLTPMALSLILVSAAWAGDDKKASDKKGEEQTIKGVISEITLVGETDVDYDTDKAVVSESVYLTIIGHPCNSEATEKGRDQASKSKEQDVKRTSNDSAKPAEEPRHRMNVYVLAVSSKTKFCECCKETGKEGASTAKEEKCNLDRLEIGDPVEVSFAMASAEKPTTKPAHQKHGRHRIYFGVADDIKILAEHQESPAAESKEKK